MVKNQHKNTISITNMRTLHWMCDKTREIRLEMTTLERERERVGLAPIVVKMVETRLWWFGHIERRLVNFVVSITDKMEGSQVTRGSGKLRKTIREAIRKNLEINELEKDIVFDKRLWRHLIHVTDST